ncbi:motile sperm domain-containing protein 2-like [Tachypleus tridentatus]|uniref:motile sperm domain-containing protein 2-like n=1 Tax=Tachypleus tridentatus TaxID=6853 RepID=UPI003FD58920
MDMELIMYITTLFKYYFPFALGYIYFYEMPWLCKAFWKILKIRLPAKTTRRFKFINKSSISNYIALDQLPTYLGGSFHFSEELEIPESDENISFEQYFL